MRLRTDRSTLPALLASVLLASPLLMTSPVVSAPAPLPSPARLGPQTVGSKLSEVRAYHQQEDCHIEAKGADCTFLSPAGVEYVVEGNAVTWVIAREKTATAVVLPFGLKFGDSLATALPKLVAQGRHWSLGPPEDGPADQVFLSSEDTYPGESGTTFDVEVYFDHDRLVRVDYDADEGD